MLHLLLAFPSLTAPTPPMDPGAALQGCLARAGDLNGDGVPDLWVAGRPGDNLNGRWLGHVWALSGSDGSVLVHIESEEKAGVLFARSIACAGDVDSDGVPDVVIGSGKRDGGGGSVEVRSGKDGQLILRVESPRDDDLFGFAVAGGRDLDKDGVPDIVVTAPVENPYPSDPKENDQARTYLISGRTGGFIAAGLRADGRRADYFIGGAGVALLPDLDKDGYPEVAAGGTVYSSRTGSLLFAMTPGGWTVGVIGDVNGDKVPDLFLSEVNREVTVRSGVDGRVLKKHNYAIGYLHGEGLSVSRLGDVDGDGVSDYIIGANESPLIDAPPDRGFAAVVSGKTGKGLHGITAADHDGIDVSGIGDIDRDGKADFAIWHRKAQRVEVYSSATWKPIWRVKIASLAE